MKFPEDRKLFTVSEVCHACGISRATLIRLEECGFLKPYYINTDTGYRYYDTLNITMIGQYQKLQGIGLTRNEITNLYYEHIDSNAFIQQERKRIEELQLFLDEYEFRHNPQDSHLISFITVPAMTCYCDDLLSSSFEETETLAYLSYETAISAGLRLFPGEPPFIFSEAWLNSQAHEHSNYPFTICIPISDCNDNNPHIKQFPGFKGIAILGYGDYSIVPGLCEELLNEQRSRSLEATGPIRISVIIAPYAGMHFKPNSYCFKCILPI